jgi:hypothetical protein
MNLDRMINNVAKKLQNISDPSAEPKKGSERTLTKNNTLKIEEKRGERLVDLR